MGKCKLLLLKKVFLDLSICWPGRLVGWQVAAQMTSHHFTAWRACWSIHPRVSWPQWWSSLWCWWRQHCPVAVVDVFGWVWQIPRRLWRNTESRCGIFDEPLSLILFGRFRSQGVSKIKMICAECDSSGMHWRCVNKLDLTPEWQFSMKIWLRKFVTAVHK